MPDTKTSHWPRRLGRWAAISALALVVLMTLMALGLWVVLKLAEPDHQGHQAVARDGGLRASVQIERDEHGIPSITAESIEDAMFGLGVAHAQDRLWQMETHRRIGAGRLAEVFGVAALDNDRFLRALGVRRAAAAQWERADPVSKALLKAYAAGVNHSIAQTRVLPPEFLILGIKPEPWSPVDSLAWTLMMAWDLGGNWTTELQRLRLSASLDRARIDELMPPYPGEEPLPVRDYVSLYRSLGLVTEDAQRADSAPPASPTLLAWSRLPDIAPPSGIEGTGSNNWVLAGSRTTTGKPLLANDPHLGLSTPALWYFARLKAPGLEVAGATLPGVPLVVLGQTRNLAWGFTNTGPDVQDLYIEAVHPEDPQRYRTPSGWAAFETVEERIAVKGGDAITLKLRRTRHGPVISDAGTIKGLNLQEHHVLALRWTALDPDVDTVAAGLGLLQAENLEGFVRASQRWVAPMQNMVVADAAGRIGMVSAGRVPVRREDNDLMGLAPAPGWESRYDWVGWLPLNETPREFDPARGWIATANQRIHDADYPHFIGSDWALPYRQQRIEQVLQSRPQHRLEDMVALQQDEVSLAAQRLLPWLKQAAPAHRLATSVLPLIQAFDGTMGADDAAPLIYWAWHRALARSLFEPRIGTETFERAFAQRTFQDALEGVMNREDPHWCDDPRTADAVETCAQRSSAALSLALDELVARVGEDPTRWKWGVMHQAVAAHRPFSNVPTLQTGFALSAPVGGDTHTVHALRVGLAGPAEQRYRATHGPSLKAVYDLEDRSRSRFIHSSGQSGLPWKNGYREWLQPWLRGQGVPVWPVEGVAPVAILRLEPR